MHKDLISLAAVLACVLQTSLSRAASTAPEPAGPPVPATGFPHEMRGENSLVVELAGVSTWVTQRRPQSDFSPVGFGLAYGHRVGVARVGSRLGVALNPLSDGPALAFLAGDLVSIERVYRVDRALRPYWRVALGFVLDLTGPRRALGEEGYFNADNGAAGGLSLGHGWGVDAFFHDAFFARLEADARLHGGAGRVGLMFGGHLGLGYVF